MIFELQNTKSI